MKQLALRQSQERANLYLPEHGTQVDTCAPIIHNSQHPQTLSHSFPFTPGQCQDAQPLDTGGGPVTEIWDPGGSVEFSGGKGAE